MTAALIPGLARAQDADAALKRIQHTKAMTIGFRESAAPFAYLDENKQPSGYSIEICNRIAQEIGKKLNITNIELKYVPITPQTRIPLAGQWNGRYRMRDHGQFAEPPGAGRFQLRGGACRGQAAGEVGVRHQGAVRS